MRNSILVATVLSIAGCSGTTNDPSAEEIAWVEQAVVSCAAGPTVKGVDVSVYQGSVNWNAVHAAGWEFAVTRIGDGYGGDSTFVTNWAGIKNAGMIRGAYQFWRAADDQNRLADIVIAAVGHLGPGDLPVMLDIEGASMQGQSAATIQSQMNLWLSRVEAGTGKKPLIYTGKYAWDPSVQSANYGSYALWIAAYGANTGGVPANCPNTPMGWSAWNFWQYSSVGAIPGIGGNVDKNLFNGDLAALQVLANGLSSENCYGNEVAGCGNYGCSCVNHACNGTFCPGTGCSAQTTANCAAYGSGCVDGACNGGTSPGSGCTAKEALDCSHTGCGCVDHLCNGGAACAGTGCTWRETHDCGGFGVNCADHQCAGGFGPGTGCTGKETTDCTAQGCGCVDHACSGGNSCAGSGSTARNALDCGAYGCHSVDGTCSGGFCPGNGCTAKQTADCAAAGASCVDEKCAGGSAAGTGCTAREALDCSNLDAGCARGACTTPSGPVVVDAGHPQPAPDDGGIAVRPDAGTIDAGVREPEVDAGTPVEIIPADDAGMTMGGGEAPPTQNVAPDPAVKGGCSSAPGGFGLMGLFFLGLARRRPSRG
jgi:lysozyme